MTNTDNFSSVYDSMTTNYRELENIMGIIYQYISENPADDKAKEMLNRLGNVAQNMITSQKEFTFSYGDSSIKETLMNGLNDKENVLLNALHETKGKTM